MTWYKFWKRSGPAGILREDYLWLDKESHPDEDSIRAECEHWAEKIPGGHNTLYRFGFQKVVNPPLSVLEKMIKKEKDSIQDHKHYLNFLQQTLETAQGK